MGWGGEFEGEGEEELDEEGKEDDVRSVEGERERRTGKKTNLSRRVREDEASERWIQARGSARSEVEMDFGRQALRRGESRMVGRDVERAELGEGDLGKNRTRVERGQLRIMSSAHDQIRSKLQTYIRLSSSSDDDLGGDRFYDERVLARGERSSRLSFLLLLLLLPLPETEETLLLLLLDLRRRRKMELDVERDRRERGWNRERRWVDLNGREREGREGVSFELNIVRKPN